MYVGPLLKLSRRIVDHGIKVNAEFIHSRLVMAAAAAAATEAKFEDQEENRIEMVSIPDGLEPGDDRKDIKKAW